MVNLQAVVAVAKELEAESYHDIKRVTARKDNVMRLWEYLLELLKARRLRLEMNLGLQRVFQEMLYIMDWMDEMKVTLLISRFLLISDYDGFLWRKQEVRINSRFLNFNLQTNLLNPSTSTVVVGVTGNCIFSSVTKLAFKC